MQHHEGDRAQLERDIADDRAELRRALRDLGFSLILGLNLPRRIRRRPLPWAIAGVAVAAIVIARRQQRKRLARRRHWWEGRGAQA